MKYCLIFLLLIMTGSAIAGPIHDARTGLIPEGTVLDVDNAVVTKVMGNSFCVSEQPVGQWNAIWVWVGELPAVQEGDIISIRALYSEHDGRSMLSMSYPEDAEIVVTGSMDVPLLYVNGMELMQEPEGYESCWINLTDGLIVSEVRPDGYWVVLSHEFPMFSFVMYDYFQLFPDVQTAECYNNADALFFWYGHEWVLKTYDVDNVDCAVENNHISFGSMKAVWR
ncbi:MAG: hypothetical protein GY752_06375 [bacterium]|nr:hypothetical protein [bacterium]